MQQYTLMKNPAYSRNQEAREDAESCRDISVSQLIQMTVQID